MPHPDLHESSATVGRPNAGDVVALQIDAVGSVAHLQDVHATRRMRAMQPSMKKYMAIIDKVFQSTTGHDVPWDVCDVRVFSSPHWVIEEDENVDTCYRVRVRLRALALAHSSSSNAEQDSALEANDDDEKVEVTPEDLEAMQRPLSEADWRRLEEAVDSVGESEDPELRVPLVLYAPIVAPLPVDVDLEADMGFPEDYLGESDRVVRELDLATRRAVLSLFFAPETDGCRRLRVEMAKARETHEGRALGHASGAAMEEVSEGDWEKLEGAVEEWVRDARARGRPPAKAIVRNGRVLVGRRTVRQPTGEFWVSEGVRLVLTHGIHSL